MKKCEHNSKEIQLLARKVGFLDSPERAKSFSPNELLKMLPIRRTDTILDLGAGTGYLSIPATKMVSGFVYALDIDPKMLEVLDSKAKAETVSNIKLVQGSTDSIPLPDNSVDIVLASLILHEVHPLSKTIQEMNRVLKEDGQFLCLEYEKTERTTDGPPMHIRIPSSVLEQELKNAGLSITQKVISGDSLYVITARK